MSTSTLTLAEFLLSRIAEDEQRARDVAPRGDNWWLDERPHHPMDDAIYDLVGGGKILGTFDATDHGPYFVGTHVAAWSPERVLAECESKRRIVAMCVETMDIQGDGFPNDDSGYEEAHSLAHAVFCMLALPYADHPDYREEWRA